MKYLQIFILLFVGCGPNPKPHEKSSPTERDTVRYAKFPWIATETNIQKLVNRIDSSDCVYYGRIGYFGEENEIFDSYERLLEITPDSMWVSLSRHKNPIIRVYAFKALQTKNSLYLQDVKVRLLKDKATVCYVSADIKMDFSVSSFVSKSK